MPDKKENWPIFELSKWVWASPNLNPKIHFENIRYRHSPIRGSLVLDKFMTLNLFFVDLMLDKYGLVSLSEMSPG